jgi:protocatechuate 3,4-dioxygenase beta subunit
MATRTRTSFQKRQKELARVEKQRDKAAKRLQRKLEGPKPEEPEDVLLDGRVVDEDGEPLAPSGQSAHQEESH